MASFIMSTEQRPLQNLFFFLTRSQCESQRERSDGGLNRALSFARFVFHPKAMARRLATSRTPPQPMCSHWTNESNNAVYGQPTRKRLSIGCPGMLRVFHRWSGACCLTRSADGVSPRRCYRHRLCVDQNGDRAGTRLLCFSLPPILSLIKPSK